MGSRQQPARECKRKMEHEPPTGLQLTKKAKSIPTCACMIEDEKLIQADLTQDHNPSYMHQAYELNPNIGPDNLDFLCDIKIRSNDGEEHRAHKILLCSLGRKLKASIWRTMKKV